MALDLFGLTCRPEMDAKVLKRDNKLGRENLGIVRVSRMSSANNEILWADPASRCPLHLDVNVSPQPEAPGP